MYMWFSFHITILELISSIHFNLLNLSSKTFVYLQSSSKKFINAQFSPFCVFHPCTCGKIFSTSFLHGIKYFKNILSLSSKYSKYTHSWSHIHVHMFTFTLMCSFHSIVAPSTLKHISFEAISFYLNLFVSSRSS